MGREHGQLRIERALEGGARQAARAIGGEGRDYLAGPFTIADIAMATVLREAGDTDLVSSRPALAAYRARCLGRPAFKRALDAQLAVFAANQPEGEAA